MPANAITSASRVERGRWKFVSSASTRRNSKPGVTKSVVRPSRTAVPRDRLEHAHRRRSDGEHPLGGLDPLPGLGPDRVALAVQLVLLERGRRQRTERVQPHMERDPLDVEPAEQLRREMKPGGRGCGRAGFVRVDRLIAGRVGERLGDVRRQRRLTIRFAVEADAPAAVAEVLDQLHRAVAPARAQAAGRPRERQPLAAALVLQQQHLTLRPLDPDPSRHDARVVHDGELAGELVRQLGEDAMADGAARPVVDEQPGGVPPSRRLLGDQLRREVVIEN